MKTGLSFFWYSGTPFEESRRGLLRAVPVICAVNAAAIGAGLALVAVSDIAIASQRAALRLPVRPNIGNALCLSSIRTFQVLLAGRPG
jgi:hypothetical protein